MLFTYKTDSRPLERKRSVPFDKLVQSVALDQRDEDTLMSLARRLAKLEKQLNADERTELKTAAGGKSIQQITRKLLDAVDPDRQIEQAIAHSLRGLYTNLCLLHQHEF